MNLTQDYRFVRAIFEGSKKDYLEESDPTSSPHEFSREFQIGPIIYEFTGVKDDRGWYIAFRYKKMVGSIQELLEYFSELRGRPVDEQELQQIRLNAFKRPIGVLGLGKSFQVFGEVFSILEQFIRTYKPRCFSFSCTDKRLSLYDKMFSQRFPPARWKKRTEPFMDETTFTFCRIV